MRETERQGREGEDKKEEGNGRGRENDIKIIMDDSLTMYMTLEGNKILPLPLPPSPSSCSLLSSSSSFSSGHPRPFVSQSP